MRVEVLKKEIEVLRKSGKAGCVRQENARCHASTLELGHPKEDDGAGEGMSLMALTGTQWNGTAFTNEVPGRLAYRTGVIVRKQTQKGNQG